MLSTDIAPTILEQFGIDVPSQMSGQPIRTEGEVDPAAVESLGERMAVIPERRGPVIGLSLLAWLVAARAGQRGSAGARWPGSASGWSGSAVVYLPLVLLLGGGARAGAGVEQLLAMFGAPLLAALTLALLGGYRALAVAVGADRARLRDRRRSPARR